MLQKEDLNSEIKYNGEGRECRVGQIGEQAMVIVQAKSAEILE